MNRIDHGHVVVPAIDVHLSSPWDGYNSNVSSRDLPQKASLLNKVVQRSIRPERSRSSTGNDLSDLSDVHMFNVVPGSE